MRFSSNQTNWSAWETYARTKSWDLSQYGGTSSAGSKTIYAQFRDAAGNLSAPASDTIEYLACVITGTASTANSSSAATSFTQVQLSSPLPKIASGSAGTVTNCQSEGPLQFCRTLPKQTTLGKRFAIEVVVKNIGLSTLARVSLQDVLPSNAQRVTGKLTKECRNVRTGRTCSNTYWVKITSTSMSARVGELELYDVQALSLNQTIVQFIAEGEGIQAVRVEVFDLRGSKVFDSGEAMGNSILWRTEDAWHRRLAQGIYLYVVSVRGIDGKVIRSEVRILALLR
jgi:hypothetical protein